MCKADVVLAPPASPGFISLYTTLHLGIPMVIFKRSDIKDDLFSLAYNGIESLLLKLGVEGFIAETRSDYVDIACRLAADPAGRKELGKRILTAYQNVKEFYKESRKPLNAFLEAAVDRARSGLPPAHWANGKFLDQ